MTISNTELQDLRVALMLALKVIVNGDPLEIGNKQREAYTLRLVKLKDRLEIERIDRHDYKKLCAELAAEAALLGNKSTSNKK
jgi:hypothetical protein